jgi:hypothetical protein
VKRNLQPKSLEIIATKAHLSAPVGKLALTESTARLFSLDTGIIAYGVCFVHNYINPGRKGTGTQALGTVWGTLLHNISNKIPAAKAAGILFASLLPIVAG